MSPVSPYKKRGNQDSAPLEEQEEITSVSSPPTGVAKTKPLQPDNLADAEQQAAGGGSSEQGGQEESSFYSPGQSSEGRVGRGYRPNKANPPSRQGMKDALRFMNNNSRRKKIFMIGGGAFALLLPIIFFLALLLPSLKIPQLAAEVESYRLARLTRQFYKNASTLTADSNAIDASTDVTTADLVGKTPFGKAFSALRPARVINNMKANGVLKYDYKPGPGGTSVLESIDVNLADGTTKTITPPSFKYKSPSDWLNNYKERLRVAQETNQAINQSLDGSNFLVRSGTAEELRSALGVNLFLWEKAGLAAFGKNQATDTAKEAELTEKEVAQPDIEGKTDAVQEVAKEAEQANEQCFENDACAVQAAEDGGVSPQANKILSDFKVSGQSYLNKISPAYAVMFPVCLAYDASSNVATQFLNSQNMAAVRLFFLVATADSQIRAGATNGAAVQALSNQAGNINDSIPGQIARGNTNVDTSAEVSPQAGRVGDYTVFNAFNSWFGGGGTGPEVDISNFIADHFCTALTNPVVGVGLTVAQIIAVLLPGSDAAEAEAIPAAEAGATEISTSLASRIVSQLSVRNIYNSAKKLAINYEATSQADKGLTYLGRMLILSQMGTLINGLDKTDFANQVDMGAVAYSNAMMQQQTFGRPLTQAETTGVEKEDVGYLNQQNQSQSSFTRNLALTNPYSPASKLAMAASSLSFSKLGSLFTNLPHLIGSIFSPTHVFGHAAAAATTNADYGMVEFGYSTDEETLINNNPSYDPLTNDQTINSTTQSDTGQSNNFQLVYGSGGVAATYAKCFGYNYDASTQTLSYDPTDQIGNLLGGTNPSIQRDSNGNVIANQGDCSPQNLGPNNPQFGDLVLRWRVDQGYQNTLGDLTGIQNVNSTNATTPTTPPASPTSGSSQVVGDFTPVCAAPADIPSITSYDWPIKPFDQQHPVRANFDDPRFAGSKDIDDATSQSFHFGVDVAAPDGTPVYAIESGKVDLSGGQSVSIVSADKMLDYWHLDYSGVLTNGQQVAQHQLIGHIADGWGHVHLAESHRDASGNVYYVNPLRPGALSPYNDNGAPVITSLNTTNGQVLSKLSGTVGLTIGSYDNPPIALPAASTGYPSPSNHEDWTSSVVSPTTVKWQVADQSGNTIMNQRTAVDFSQYLCSADIFSQIYASGTVQNAPGVGGSYNYYLINNWDTTKMQNGTYTITVTSTDNRNNSTQKSFTVKINN